jgi:hypothetical protein
MGIVQLPGWRSVGGAERVAFRRGLAGTGRIRPPLRVIREEQRVSHYCTACAAPIEFGVVWRGLEAYCSVECSLGGGRPA